MESIKARHSTTSFLSASLGVICGSPPKSTPELHSPSSRNAKRNKEMARFGAANLRFLRKSLWLVLRMKQRGFAPVVLMVVFL
jgi:hypothetical protein